MKTRNVLWTCAILSIAACASEEGLVSDAEGSNAALNQVAETPGKLTGSLNVDLSVALLTQGDLGSEVSLKQIMDESQRVASGTLANQLSTLVLPPVGYRVVADIKGANRTDQVSAVVQCLSKSNRILDQVELVRQGNGTYVHESLSRPPILDTPLFYPLNCFAFRANVITPRGTWTGATVLNPVTPSFFFTVHWGKLGDRASLWFRWMDSQDRSRRLLDGTQFSLSYGKKWVVGPQDVGQSKSDSYTAVPIALLTVDPAQQNAPTTGVLPTSTAAPTHSGVFSVYYISFLKLSDVDSQNRVGVHLFRRQKAR